METIIKVIKSEMEKVELKHKVELYEKEKEILNLKKEIEELKNNNKLNLLKANRIRWSEDGKYYNLSDFCRVTKDLLFINETSLKQFLLQEGVLIKQNDKYIPTDDIDTCILIDNELYIDYDYIRGTIMFMRTCIYLDEELKSYIKVYNKNQDVLREKMSNTVYIDCKQRSKEFQRCKENKFFIKDNEVKNISKK